MGTYKLGSGTGGLQGHGWGTGAAAGKTEEKCHRKPAELKEVSERGGQVARFRTSASLLHLPLRELLCFLDYPHKHYKIPTTGKDSWTYQLGSSSDLASLKDLP